MGDKERLIKESIRAFEEKEYEFDIFRDGVVSFFLKNPKLVGYVHSVRSRIKDKSHLGGKISRKWDDKDPIDKNSLFHRITDLAGVRVLHLHQGQFEVIHQEIINKVDSKDWFLDECPVAYTWDPESEAFFKKFDFKVVRKESLYTSIHYVVRPRSDSPICCEIQVRTLFEEVWGEIDHTLNYPQSTNNLACREQILVLAKLVGAGSRLVDAIFRTYQRVK